MQETMVAIQAAKQAALLLRKQFFTERTLGFKQGNELVTDMDVQAEKVILDILKNAYPDYSIMSEEAGARMTDSDYLWVVDPLDGSTNYSIRNPFCAVSIGLAAKGPDGWGVVSGVIVAPFTKEVFFAEKGEGAFLNGNKIAVAPQSDMKNLLLTYCSGADRHAKRAIDIIAGVREHCRDINKMRAGALELAYVAAGRLGAYISPGGKPWDAAAGSLLVMEAGGKVSDFSGGPWALVDEADILATNGAIHPRLLELVKGK